MTYICGYCNKPIYEDDIKVYIDGLYYHKDCSSKVQGVHIPDISNLYKKGDNKYNPLALPFFVKYRDEMGKVFYECKLCHTTIHKPIRGEWDDVLYRHMRNYHAFIHQYIKQVITSEQ